MRMPLGGLLPNAVHTPRMNTKAVSGSTRIECSTTEDAHVERSSSLDRHSLRPCFQRVSPLCDIPVVLPSPLPMSPRAPAQVSSYPHSS